MEGGLSATDRERWNQRYRDGAYADRRQPSIFCSNGLIGFRGAGTRCGLWRRAQCALSRRVRLRGGCGGYIGRGAGAGPRYRCNRACSNWLEHDLEQPLSLQNPYQLILNIRYVNLPLLR